MKVENWEIRLRFWGVWEVLRREMWLSVMLAVFDLSIMKVLTFENVGEWKLARILWMESILDPTPIVNESF
jgi:hypothetical protein